MTVARVTYVLLSLCCAAKSDELAASAATCSFPDCIADDDAHALELLQKRIEVHDALTKSAGTSASKAGPADALGLVNADSNSFERLSEMHKALDNDWEAVEKDETGRVTVEAFTKYFMAKYKDQVTEKNEESYQAFLEKDFSSALAMMLPREETNLGGHCFRYASILAGEFYFDGAKQAR